LGTQEIQRQRIGFRLEKELDQERLRQTISTALKQTFRPELLNRIDEIIIFDSLTEQHLHQIIELLLKEVQKRLSEHRITVELSESAKAWLIKEGYDPVYGARPLRRAIQHHVENPLSKRILDGEFVEGDVVLVDSVPDGLTITKKSV